MVLGEITLGIAHVTHVKPCLQCQIIRMDKLHGKFHWMCVHKKYGRVFGSAAEVVFNGWSGLPNECPVVAERAQPHDRENPRL